MWYPIISVWESSTSVNNAIAELNEALSQEDLLCFDADKERTSQIKLAIDILKGNRNDLIS